MNCNRVKKLQFTYWEQSTARQKEFDSHLQACPECQKSFHQIGSLVDLCRKSVTAEEKLDDFQHYYARLGKRLVKLNWLQRLRERILITAGMINRSVWGPVPAYAVVAVILLAVVVVLPLSQSGESMLSTQSAFSNSLILEPLEPMRATSEDGMTIYVLAQNTVPNPTPGTAPTPSSATR
jgi:anti-sigma factor RsiW